MSLCSSAPNPSARWPGSLRGTLSWRGGACASAEHPLALPWGGGPGEPGAGLTGRAVAGTEAHAGPRAEGRHGREVVPGTPPVLSCACPIAEVMSPRSLRRQSKGQGQDLGSACGAWSVSQPLYLLKWVREPAGHGVTLVLPERGE